MGPDTYDLVSLLRDSYVDITDRELDELIAYFLALKADDRGRRRRVPAAVRPDGAAAQPEGARHVRLPDDRRAATPVYIQYMPRTLRYVRANLEKYPRFARLRELLARMIEELRERVARHRL